MELGVGQAIVGRVLAGVGDGVGHDFQAQHPAGLAGQQQANGADAAVGIDDRVRAAYCRHFQQAGVEAAGLLGVHLEKGGGRDGEAQAGTIVVKVAGAPQKLAARAAYLAARPVVEVSDYRHHLRQSFANGGH